MGALPTPSREGYIFEYWVDSRSRQITSSTVVPGLDTAYYAVWSFAPVTLTFNGSGGMPARTTISEIPGNRIGALPVPYRDGYTFVGWFDADDRQISSSTWVPDSDTTYYARWEYIPVLVTITLDGNGGSPALDSVRRMSDSEMRALPIPRRPGYTFEGWYTTSALTGGAQITYSTVVPRYNTTYYARWSVAPPVALTFDGGDGKDGDIPYLRTMVRIPGYPIGNFPDSPTLRGFAFDGWATANGARIDENTLAPYSDTTYYAKWRPVLTLDLPAFGGWGSTWNYLTTIESWNQFPKIPPHIRNRLPYFGAVLDAVEGLLKNIDDATPGDKMALDVVVDLVVSGLSIAYVALLSWLGAPVIVGLLIGLAIYFLSDVIKYGDKSLRDQFKDWLYNILNPP